MNSNDNLSEQDAYLKELNALFIPLDGMKNLDSMVKAIGDADIVLLGEASHGTSDFYRVRAELSKKLITSKGFNIIGVEGDWPSAYRLNRYVKGMEGPILRQPMHWVILPAGRPGCGRIRIFVISRSG